MLLDITQNFSITKNKIKSYSEFGKEFSVMKLTLNENIFTEEKRPTNNCHASTLVKIKDGVMAAWFGGNREGTDDVGILYSRRVGGTWSEPKMLPRTKNLPHWNPVLFRMPNGKIYLFYKVGKTITVWQTFFRVSDDEGETFGEEYELVKGDIGGRGPVKNKPILLSNGEVRAPASYEPSQELTGEERTWKCFVDRTDDCGESWTCTDYISKPLGVSVIQPTLWESIPGKVHMFTRSRASFVYRSDSTDFGKTWCCMYPTNIPNNNSGIDCALAENGLLALVYNPVGADCGKRTPIVVAFSRDNGETFENPITLEDADGEFSYPSVIADGNKFCITFTDRRLTVRYCEVEF